MPIKAYEDDDFVVGETGRVLDIFADLNNTFARFAVLQVFGPGDLKIANSFDGSLYEDDFTFEGGQGLLMTDLRVKKLKLTHTGVDSGYRIWVGS